MGSIDIAETVVVFDLDDTLYFESEYRASGIKAVVSHVRHLYDSSIREKLDALDLESLQADFLEDIVRLMGCPPSVKQSLLWLYRLHLPEIHLRDGMEDLIEKIESLCAGIAILTDGRSISQRQKLRALGIQRFPCYISEEYSSEKPDPRRFEKIMSNHSARRYIYVADNPKKDFLAPNSLGWTTIGLNGFGKTIHSQECADLPAEFNPWGWISHPVEMLSILGLRN